MKTEEFTQRVQRVRERLYRTAYLYLGREHDALEAVDEAVYRAFQSRFRLREAAFFETWITRVLINLCKDELRRRRPKRLRSGWTPCPCGRRWPPCLSLCGRWWCCATLPA